MSSAGQTECHCGPDLACGPFFGDLCNRKETDSADFLHGVSSQYSTNKNFDLFQDNSSVNAEALIDSSLVSCRSDRMTH